jgi:GTP-binding protein HflX
VHEIHERGEIFSEEYVEAGTSIHGRVDGTLAAAIEKVQVRGE